MNQSTNVSTVELHLLGGYELWVPVNGAREQRHLTYQRAKALLAILAMEPVTHSREAVADRLWPDAPRTEALSLLRRMLHTLKDALGDASTQLITQRTSVRLLPASECDAYSLDTWSFEGQAQNSTANLVTGQALFSRYKGPFLSDVNVPSADFEHWQLATRNRLHTKAVRLGLTLADAQLRSTGPATAISTLQRVLELEPTHEDAMALLLRVRQQQGALHTAREEWAQFEHACRRAMGAPPSSALRALARQLTDATTSATSAPFLPDKLPLTVLHLSHRPGEQSSLEQRFEAQRAWRTRCLLHLQQAGGHVLQTPSAGITACFGYPIPRESACEQAVLTGLAAVSTDTAAGLAWGWVLVPEPGSNLEAGGSVSPLHWPDVGFYVTQEAQQLAQQSKAGRLLVNEAVYQTLRSAFDWEPNTHPASPTGVRTLPPSQTGSNQHHSFWGREDDLDWLSAQAKNCLTSTASLCDEPTTAGCSLIEAAAGMGKSLLLQHWLNTDCLALQDGKTITQTHVMWVQARQVWAYAPFRAMEATWGRITGASPSPDSHLVLRRAWVTHLIQSIERPTIVVFEDAHWLDPSSVDVLHHLTQQPATWAAPCWILITSRPGHDLSIRPESTRTLCPLTDSALETLASEIAPHWSKYMRQQAVSHSGGNTLHLKALLTMPTHGHQLPTRLSDALQAQLHPLGTARAAAEWAAVIGPRFARADLERLWPTVVDNAGAPEVAVSVDQTLQTLRRQGLIHPDGETHFRFHHTLQCEALRMSIRADRLSSMHAQVLDTLGIDDKQDDPESIADRCAAAERWEAACHWRQVALHKARKQHAFTEVAHHAQAWMHLVRKHLPNTSAQDEFDTLMVLANAQAALLGYGAPEAQALYSQALEKALALNQNGAKFAATWALWLGASSANGYQSALEMAERLMAMPTDDPCHHAMAVYALGNTLVCMGRFEEAIACLSQLPQFEWPPSADWAEDAVAHGLAFLALAHARAGQLGQARSAAARALRRTRHSKLPATTGQTHSLVAMLHVLHHNWPTVGRHGQRIFSCGITHELALWQASGQLMIQSAAVARSEPGAWDLLEACVNALPAIMSGVEGFFLTALVSAGIQSRSWTRLEPWIARGLALPATRQDRFFEDGFQRASILCAEKKPG